jgi:hypothetical protein
MIGPKPLNAFVPKDMGWSAVINTEATGVLISLPTGQEHFVFGANIQSVRLETQPLPVTQYQGNIIPPFQDATDNQNPPKNKGGRPRIHPKEPEDAA